MDSIQKLLSYGESSDIIVQKNSGDKNFPPLIVVYAVNTDKIKLDAIDILKKMPLEGFFIYPKWTGEVAWGCSQIKEAFEIITMIKHTRNDNRNLPIERRSMFSKLD